MNWRRGLVLAGINVLVALPMICILASRDEQARRNWRERSAAVEGFWADSSGEVSAPRTKIVRAQEEQTVTFTGCGLWRSIPVEESVVQMGNLPAFVVSQWREDCPPKWSVARILGVNDTGMLTDANFSAMRRVDVALCLMIAVQWLLVGSFPPLIQARRWWAEPGAFITTCTAIASGIALVPWIAMPGRLPALIACLAWLWWFGLLFWRIGSLAWQSTLGGLRRLSN